MAWQLEAGTLEVQKSRDRIVKQLPECGDASACLMLRTPVTRRDRSRLVSKGMPAKTCGSWPDSPKKRRSTSLREVRTQV
jgi:hypothetical protein